MKRIVFFLFIAGLLIQQIIVLPGCANIVPPEGGPRDTIPPVLLKSEPGDSARNFRGNRIVLLFDEFVDVQNVRENLIVSPLPKMDPVVEFKLKTVTIKLKDSLESNTTYSLNFGNSIKDFTEGNPVKDMVYTFSTGPYFDSLELRGRVVLAETGKIDTTLIVMLHTSPDDSSVVKDRPRYIARLDSKGNFLFKNLPPKTFYVYALKDEGGTHRYFGDKQLFGFGEKPVVVSAKPDPVTLYAYTASSPSASAANNSLANLLNNRRKPNETADKRLKYQNSLVNNQQDLLTGFNLAFEQPLQLFDSSKITLYTDSTFKQVSSYRFRKDSSGKKIILTVDWKENTLYHIILDKDFAADSAGRKLLKTDTLTFTTKRLDEYGSLKLKFRNLQQEKNPVLLFVQNETIYKSFPLTGSEFSQALFVPGEFELRILFDTNKNGRWDPGGFFGKHQQPEIVKPVERRILVKPNWQNEFEIAL